MAAINKKRRKGDSSDEDGDPSYSPVSRGPGKRSRGNIFIRTQREQISRREEVRKNKAEIKRKEDEKKTVEEDIKDEADEDNIPGEEEEKDESNENEQGEKEEEKGEKEEEKQETNEPEANESENNKPAEEEKEKEEQATEAEAIKCQKCDNKPILENTMEDHTKKMHEVLVIELKEEEDEDLKAIPEVKMYHTKSIWFGQDKNFPSGMTLRSTQAEFIQMIPTIQDMLKKKEGFAVGDLKIKATTIERKGKQEYKAVVIASKKTKLATKTNKAAVKIYTNTNSASITITTLRGSSVETTHQIGELLEKLIEKRIEGKTEAEAIEDIEEEEQIAVKLREMREKSLKARKTCTQCKRSYKSEFNLRKHNEKEHKIPCTICKIRMKNEEDLKKHNQRIHKIKETCSICKKEFVDREDMREHIRKRHEVNVVTKCDLCSNDFYNKATMEDHRSNCVNKKVEDMSIDCDHCSKTFVSTKELEDHQQEITKETEAKPKCGECKNTFESEPALYVHIKEQHTKQDKTVICLNCKEQIENSEEGMSEHLNKHHNDLQKSLKCQLCDEPMIDEAELQEHMKSDHTEYKCDLCGDQLENNAEKDVHMKLKHSEESNSNEAEQTFKCESCDQEVKSEEEMNLHRSSHEVQLINQCNECGKRNFTTETLETHNKLMHEQVLVPKIPAQINGKSKRIKRKIKHDQNYTKPIPKALRGVHDSTKRMLIVSGGGACQIDCIASKALGDAAYGPQLKRAVNIEIAENIDEYEQFGYTASEDEPFMRETGAGDKFNYTVAYSKKDLVKLLKEGDSLTLWGDNGELKASADILRRPIRIDTVLSKPDDDNKEYWTTTIEPKNKAEGAETIELILLEKEEHYYLVVDEAEYIARGTVSQRLKEGKELTEDIDEDSSEKEERLAKELSRVNDLLRETLEENMRLKDEDKRMMKIRELDERYENNKKKMEKLDQEDKEKTSPVKVPQKPSYAEKTSKNQKAKKNLIKCKTCGEEREYGEAMAKHVEKVHKVNKQFNCNECQYQGEDIDELETHRTAVHKGTVNYPCDQCNFACDGTIMMKNHVKECHTLTCDQCNFTSRLGSKMDAHKKETHDEVKMSEESDDSEDSDPDEDPEEAEEEETYKFPCYWKNCKIGFMSMKELRKHRASKHKSTRQCQWYRKDECKWSEDECSFQHKDEEEIDEKIECQICETKLKTRPELFKHRKAMHEANVRTCEKFEDDNCERDQECWLIHKSEEERKDEEKECKFGKKCNNLKNGRKCYWKHKKAAKSYESRIFNKTPFQRGQEKKMKK